MHPALRAAVDDRGYSKLTPVQTLVLDPALKGRDLLVSAQTGSGKTLGFGLAIAPTLLGDDHSFAPGAKPLAVVIAPTRELALQVKRELGWLYAKAGAVLASCVGGMDMRDERRALERGAHIVAATPGRLRDHITRGSIDLSDVRAVVLDEADEMLDLGFREELEFILDALPPERQTLLFSATVPPAIAALAKGYQNDAERIVAKSETPQHDDIEYQAMMVTDRDVDNAVINTLRYHEAPNALVFANTRAMVNRLAARLSNRGFNAVALSGELSQTERSHALQSMRDGRAQVCVATDVAARGIDLPRLDLVVHAELPSNQETLLHRSGRTGRAGRKGVSALIVTPRTRKKAERLLGWAKVRAEWGSAPSAAEIRAMDEERLFSDPAWQEPATEDEQESAKRLLDAFTPEQIATGYLRLLHTLRAPPEELAEPGTKPDPVKEFGPATWFSVSGGRDAGAEPRRLLPMLCKAGGLTKDDIGAIRVQKDQSFVQIRNEAVATLLASVGESMVLEKGAQLSQLASPPDLATKGSGLARNTVGRRAAGAKPHRPEASSSARQEPAQATKPDRTRAFRTSDGLKDAVDRAPAEPRVAAEPKRKPKGSPPPKGKPSSKKNRARAAAVATSKGSKKTLNKAGPTRRQPGGSKPSRGKS
ncbi:DEAD/DEAH box helicase [Palleronia pelagia]|uniref:ATP-dependent RNA helicase DeaD n=1 Tax=Palleronia pelagia TaxID=387096 RepID=A0A1H8LC65_9RHOB|nr:DEAD/DEAH box helicase [Palleronia pelagia]SEO02683.1 ATP-dependent RNA helicase DeaD [Palleronia pelagia]